MWNLNITHIKQNHTFVYEAQSIQVKYARAILPFALSISSRIFMIRDMTYGGREMYTYIFNGIKRRARRFIGDK